MSKNALKQEGVLSKDNREIINNNFADVARCDTQLLVDSGGTGTTLQNVSGLVTGILKPGTYRFYIHLITTATSNSGVKAALKQSVANMLSSLAASVSAKSAAAIANTTVTSTTDAASLVAATTAYVAVTIEGTLIVAKEGTLQLQAAQNASHADDTTIEVGSYMEFRKIA